ncbi:alanine racemase [Streptomyces sp. NPDC059696]|uniref:alanine racemase n=1 Tax=Streptomyces sp. NPDC059696 TaxID=3346911 RepID=UPI0036BDD9D1
MRTTAVLLDPSKAQRNIREFHHLIHSIGPVVRSHVKGHRLIELAQLQSDLGAVGVMAQTTPEAAAYLAAGIPDVVIARAQLDVWRLPRIVEFAARVRAERPDARLAVNVADAETVGLLGPAAVAAGVELALRVDVSFGDDRGVAPERAARLAALVDHTPGVRLAGVAGYTNITTRQDMRDAAIVARRVAGVLTELADEIRRDGIECPTVSVSGTAGAAAAARVPGVTEICAGAYALFDAGSAETGVCTADDVALCVRTRVVDVTGDRVRTDADGLLATAYHDWDPDVTARDRDGRQLHEAGLIPGQSVDLLPAHICPFMLQGLPVHLLNASGVETDRWHPVLLPESPH